MGWFRQKIGFWLAGKQAKRVSTQLLQQKNDAMTELTEELRLTSVDYKTALKEAQELNKIITMRNRIAQLRAKTQKLEEDFENDDEEDEEEDEEDEEEDDPTSQIVNSVVKNLSKGLLQGQGQTSPPLVSITPTSTAGGDARRELEELIGKIPDDKLEKYLAWGKKMGYIR